MSTAAPEAAACTAPVHVPLSDVERELDRQMRRLRRDDESPVARVRMSNLVIYCDCPRAAGDIAAQVSDIVAVHPARVLLLIGDPTGPETEAAAAVQVTGCRASHQQNACSELVVLRAGGSSVGRLPFAVRALVVGDVPVNLWWASPTAPALAGTLVNDLGEYAQQIMYDSVGWTDPARGVAACATWIERIERCDCSRWRVASDLNWRRLKYWRRLVTQALDPSCAPGAAESIREIVVEHGPHAVIQAWELISWIARQLGWRVQAGKVQPGVEIAWRFQTSSGETLVRVRRLEEGPPQVRSVRIACALDGKRVTMTLAADGESRLAIRLEGSAGMPRTVAVPPLTAAELVGKQLSDRERDVVFRESMAVAQSLAQSLLK